MHAVCPSACWTDGFIYFCTASNEITLHVVKQIVFLMVFVNTARFCLFFGTWVFQKKWHETANHYIWKVWRHAFVFFLVLNTGLIPHFSQVCFSTGLHRFELVLCAEVGANCRNKRNSPGESVSFEHPFCAVKLNMLETCGYWLLYILNALRGTCSSKKKKAIVKSSNYADILNVRIAVGLTIIFSDGNPPFFFKPNWLCCFSNNVKSSSPVIVSKCMYAMLKILYCTIIAMVYTASVLQWQRLLFFLFFIKYSFVTKLKVIDRHKVA